MQLRLPRLRTLVQAVLLALLAVLLLALPALADQGGSGITPTVPNADSPNGRRIYDLYMGISIPAILIFLLVEGLLLVIVLRFRRSQRPPGWIPPQWHSHTLLEITWTVIPLLIILTIGFFSFLELQRDFVPRTDAQTQLDITITGFQFGWEYSYDDQGIKVTSNGNTDVQPMVIPRGEVVRIKTQSRDVIHSWWVPYLMGKTDAVPGYQNYTWLQPTKDGEYRGECAELCGTGHATMLLLVKVVEPDQFQAWVAQQKAHPSASPSASASASPSPSPSPATGARTGSPAPSPSS